MRTIKLNKEQLQDFVYEFTSSDLFDDDSQINEQFFALYNKAVDEAGIKYKEEYGEDPDLPFDPDFSELVAEFLPPTLYKHYDEFYIDEITAEQDEDHILSACFYAVKNGEKLILIQAISGKMVY